MSEQKDAAKVLSDRWVERIFARLMVRYGVAFLRKWDGIDLELVKQDWARRLGGFSDNSAALAFGLEHLPELPPTVDQFAEICRKGPGRPSLKKLAAPVASAEMRERIVAMVRKAIRPNSGGVHLMRAVELQRLRERKASGQPMTMFHIEMLRKLEELEGQKGSES